jgi:tetratricopeptide (TPR) repeat protein
MMNKKKTKKFLNKKKILFGVCEQVSRYVEALEVVKELVGIVRVQCGTESARFVTCQQKVGWAQKNCGLYADALDTLSQVLSIAETHNSCRPILPDILVELARAYLHLGRFSPDLIAMQQKALNICEEIWRPRHSRVGTVLNNMAIVLIWRGELAAAEPICLRSLQVRREALGETHPYAAHSMACLAQLRYFQGSYDEAASLLRKAGSFYSVKRPEPLCAARANYGRVLFKQGKVDEGIDEVSKALGTLQASHASQSSDQLATIILDLAAMLATRNSHQDDLVRAKQLVEQAISIRAQLGEDHPSFKLTRQVSQLIDLKMTTGSKENIFLLTDRINVSQLTLYINCAT